MRERVVRGLAGGLLYEIASVVLSTVAMVVLVRLLTPADYGQAAAAAGIIAMIGAFRGAMFAEHAIQHAKDKEPDWDAYFALTGGVQIVLFGAALAAAVACRASESLAPLAPLLAAGAVGFLVDWPAQVVSVKLRRELRIDRLKLLSGLSLLVRLSSSVTLAWLGFGALALVIGNNVLSAVPVAAELMRRGGWHLGRGSLRIPPRAIRVPILHFGVQQIALGFVRSLRAGIEGLVVTHVLGASALGLINRAQALYQTTAGRVGMVMVESLYPLLPREQADARRYAERATRFVEVALVLLVPGAVFVALEGRMLSRLLYGPAWTPADSLLAPAALAVAGAALVSVTGRVLMGAGRMPAAVRVETASAAAAGASLILIWVTPSATSYLWLLAAVQIVSAAAALMAASRHLTPQWRTFGLWPALGASLVGAASLHVARPWMPSGGIGGVTASALLFGVPAAAVVVIAAKPLMREVLLAFRIRPRRVESARLAPVDEGATRTVHVTE